MITRTRIIAELAALLAVSARANYPEVASRAFTRTSKEDITSRIATTELRVTEIEKRG
jgi:hypothetical protein